MAKLAWYKRYPADALRGMHNLTLEQCGAYNKVLDLIYLTENQLREDDRALGRELNCTAERWRRIKGELVALGKIRIENGLILNGRATKEVDKFRGGRLVRPRLRAV